MVVDTLMASSSPPMVYAMDLPWGFVSPLTATTHWELLIELPQKLSRTQNISGNFNKAQSLSRIPGQFWEQFLFKKSSLFGSKNCMQRSRVEIWAAYPRPSIMGNGRVEQWSQRVQLSASPVSLLVPKAISHQLWILFLITKNSKKCLKKTI